MKGQPERASSAFDEIWGRSGHVALVVMLAVTIGACGRTEIYPLASDNNANSGDGGHAGVGGGAGRPNSMGAGGAGGLGGKAGIGGAIGAGGAPGVGGAIGAGGAPGVGGRIGAGGAPGVGGRIGAGGAPGMGGAIGGVGGNNISGVLIPITGKLNDLVIDADGRHVYVTNPPFNRVEDVSLATLMLQAPIEVGSQPEGLDLTADGRTLYVANSAVSGISVVDLASRTELREISVPSNGSGDRPFSLAIAASGQALFSTTFNGSGFGGRMMILDIATDAVTVKSDFFISGATTEATVLRASRDRSVVGAVAGDISSAPVFLYRSSTNLFTPEHDLNTFISNVALNHDGSAVLVDGTYVLDQNLNLLGTIPSATSTSVARGAAFAPSGPLAYRASQATIEIVDTSRFMVTGTKSVPDTMTSSSGSSVGRMAVTSDGTRAAVITDHGLSLVMLP